MTSVVSSGHSYQAATSIASPIGSKKSGKGGHKVESLIIWDAGGQTFGLRGRLDYLELVAQPLNHGPCMRNAAFQCKDNVCVPAQLIRWCGEQSMSRWDAFGTSVHHEKGPGAERTLRLSRFDGCLPK